MEATRISGQATNGSEFIADHMKTFSEANAQLEFQVAPTVTDGQCRVYPPSHFSEMACCRSTNEMGVTRT